MWVLFANEKDDKILLERIYQNVDLVKSIGLERIEPSRGKPMLISNSGKITDIQEINRVLFNQSAPPPRREQPPPRREPAPSRVDDPEKMPLDNVKTTKNINIENDDDLETLLYR